MILLCESLPSPKNCRETGFRMTDSNSHYANVFSSRHSIISEQNISNSFWVFFFRPWDFLDNMCLSQSCLRDYIIPIIPQCRLSRGKNCERRTDYTNETNLYGLLTQIIYGVGKSFCSHLFWMEFILSKKKGSSIPATTQTCERLIKS